MAAQPNVAGTARISYIVAGTAIAGWGLWGAAAGWTQWFWLVLGGISIVLGIIGYSPVHAVLRKKDSKAV